MAGILIIGSGLAAYTLAREIRKLDGGVALTLVSRDSGDFYSKPMLSSALAQGKTAAALVMTAAAKMAEQLAADIITQREVTAIDTSQQRVSLSDGRSLDYQQLVLAVGADPLRIPFAGGVGDAVLSVNDIADYAVFREKLAEAGDKGVTIIGAGLIGCEFANDLIGSGYPVDVIGLGATPLDTLIPPAAGQSLQQALAAAGVRWHLHTSVAAIHRQANGYRLELDNGQQLDSGVVLSAIGLRPRIALARQAGLSTARGIVVDALLRSSNDNIYALGDCAEVEGRVLPYVMPIMHGAKALARTLLGEPSRVSYPLMPVVVKTTLHPITLAGEVSSSELVWQIEAVGDGVKAVAMNKAAEMVGFCLSGEEANKQKQALQKQIKNV